MLLHESRRAARTSPDGEVILLDDQDRSLWNREQIAEGLRLVEQALGSRRFGPYTIQAAIAAVHAEAAAAGATDWAQIVGLYDVLLRADPSPVIELNRAVAMAMRDGPAAGLAVIDAILGRGELQDYRPGACGARGTLPPARPHGRRARVVRTRPRSCRGRTPSGGSSNARLDETSLIIGGMNGDRGTPQWMWDRFIDDLDRAGQAGSAADVILPALASDLPTGTKFGDLTARI